MPRPYCFRVVIPGLLLVFCLATRSAEAQVFDEVMVKDGSHIIGDIIQMTDGTLTMKTIFGGEVKIEWKEVTSIKTVKSLPFVLSDGSRIQGRAEGGDGGRLRLQGDMMDAASTVDLSSVTAINPPPRRPIRFKGNFSIGASIADGNTRTKAFSLLGEFEARSEKQRLTLRGVYNYSEDSGDVTAQYGRGSIKYDYFITKRIYAFANALFEHDGEQDLSLRTALSAGPGWQIIDQGDFEADWVKGLELSVEAGIAYYNEDYKRTPDDAYAAARWAAKLDWPFVPDKVTFFHHQEGYPGLENAEDIYILTETGLRFTIFSNFTATAQVNWRWDNTPQAGELRSDTLYLFSLGWGFDA